ncbi:hypothetical protein [Gracilimonas sp.]|uniref:hypothetical protein n=1 Tax=Gracilimonas sp. TaxID=1974203 RepID=UPI00287265FA|nr:hypothetical protein [Gracilimonas sp.]
MYKEEEYKNSPSDDRLESGSRYNPRESTISSIINYLHSVNGLHLISSVTQILVGLAVVTLSLLNGIQPLWLATIMTVMGSISTMIGIFFLYRTITKTGAFDSLLHRAIKRVINSQN